MTLTMTLIGAAIADSAITINNSSSDRTYKFYKIFNVTTDGTHTSTFYSGNDATFIAALTGSGSPFTVETELGGVYSITNIAAGESPTEIRDWLASNIPSDATVYTATGNPPTASLPDGYYLMQVIKTADNSLLIASTLEVTGSAVTVNDKNTTTTIDKKEQVGGTTYYDDSTKAEGQAHKTEDPIPSAKVGDTVSYTLTGTFPHYINGEKAVSFTFVDILSSGLTRVQDVAVKIGGETKTVTTDYTVTYSSQTMTIVVPTVNSDANKTFKYTDGVAYEITYTATINETALTKDVENNTVDLDFTDENGNSHDVDNDETKVKTYSIGLIKYAGSAATGNELAGAKFELYDVATSGTAISLYASGTPTASTSNNTYIYKPDNTTGLTPVTEMIAGTDGKIIVKGLARGTYYFEETEAPAGYNKLTERKSITTADAATAGTPNFVSMDVINQSGVELPSTGGIGTTIFYIVGAVLVLGAAAVILARRKAEQE